MSSFDRIVQAMDRQLLQVLGDEATVNGTTVRVGIYHDMELLDDEGSVTVVSHVARVRKDDLPAWDSGDVLTITNTGKQYKLLKTLEDDGHLLTMEVR